MNFCAASWRQRARDRFLGWSPDVREANLDRVVAHQRLLILPRVRVWALASSVLREAVRRLPEDWRWLQGMDRAREPAEACPNTRVITVCDQEGDFRDLLLKAESERQGLRVRGRRRQARWILVRDQLQDLWEWMASRPPRGGRTLSLPGRGGSQTRRNGKRTLEMRAERVEMGAPQRHAKFNERVGMLAVSATEPTPLAVGVVVHRWASHTARRPVDDSMACPAMDHRGALPDAQDRLPGRGPEVRSRRRPAQAPRVRCHHRLTGLRSRTPSTRTPRTHGPRLGLARRNRHPSMDARGNRDAMGEIASEAEPRHSNLRHRSRKDRKVPSIQGQSLPGVQKVWQASRTLKLVCKGVQRAKNSTPAVTDSSMGK